MTITHIKFFGKWFITTAVNQSALEDSSVTFVVYVLINEKSYLRISVILHACLHKEKSPGIKAEAIGQRLRTFVPLLPFFVRERVRFTVIFAIVYVSIISDITGDAVLPVNCYGLAADIIIAHPLI